MMIGETLVAQATAYSPWFEADADGATFAVEVLGIIATGNEDPGGNIVSQLVVAVETKKADDPDGSATALPGQLARNTRGTSAGSFSGFEELVRFRYEVQIASFDFFAVHFRMLPPMWLCNRTQGTLEDVLEKGLDADPVRSGRDR